MPRGTRLGNPSVHAESDCVANYQIEKELFRSQNGAVFKARRVRGHANAALGQVVCLKERRVAELGAHKDMMNEVKLLQSVQHPNVVKCFGSFRDPIRGSLFIVLEYVDGGDLWHELQRRKNGQKGGRTLEYFSEASVWGLFYQICQGLHALHRQGIVHRDIKSLNILLSKDLSVAKIADLGVSRQVSNATAFLTTCYGTPLYASPEICKSSPYDEKTDLWSLGVVLYEMAALVPPFVAPSLVGLGDAIKAGRFAPLPKFYSSTLSNLVASLLHLNPEKRPAIAKVLNYFKASPDNVDQATAKNAAAGDAAAQQSDSEPSSNNDAMNPSRQEPPPSMAPVRPGNDAPVRDEEERVPLKHHREDNNLVPQRRREGVADVEKEKDGERVPVAREHRNDNDVRRNQPSRKNDLRRDEIPREDEPRRRNLPPREERRDNLPEVEPVEPLQHQQSPPLQPPPPQLSSAQWRRAATELRRKKLQLKNLEAFAQAHAQAAAATAAVDGAPANLEEGEEARGISAQLRRRRDQESLEVARVAQQIELLEAMVAPMRNEQSSVEQTGVERGDRRRRHEENRHSTPSGDDGIGGDKQRHQRLYLGRRDGHVPQHEKRPPIKGAWGEEAPLEGRRALAEEQEQQRKDGVDALPRRAIYDVPTYGQREDVRHPSRHHPRELPPSRVVDRGQNPPVRPHSAVDPSTVPLVAPEEHSAPSLGAAAHSAARKGGLVRVVGGAPASPAPRAAVLVARAEEKVENPLLGFGERHKVVDPRRGRHMAFNNNNPLAAANRNYLPNQERQQQQQQQAPTKPQQQQVAAAFGGAAPGLVGGKAQEQQRCDERRAQRRAERFGHNAQRGASPIKVRHEKLDGEKHYRHQQREQHEARAGEEREEDEPWRERPTRSSNPATADAFAPLPERHHHHNRDKDPSRGPGPSTKVERESIRQLQARSKGSHHQKKTSVGVLPPAEEEDNAGLSRGDRDPRRYDHRQRGERSRERSGVKAAAQQPQPPTGRSTARFNFISGGWA